jgi:biopolymer transport protein ExbB/TolQ
MKHLLVLQLIIVNLIGASALVWAWSQHYVQTVFEADTSRICYAITALFAFGLVSCFIRAVKVSRMLDASKVRVVFPIRRKLIEKSGKAEPKNRHLSKIAEWLTLMGLFGTVVGLITMAMSLKGNMGGLDNLSAALSQAFEGYGVALATTAVGIVAGGWIEVNALFISTATSCLEKDVAE